MPYARYYEDHDDDEDNDDDEELDMRSNDVLQRRF